MNDLRTLINELCESLQNNLNQVESSKGNPATHKVVLTSALKPEHNKTVWYEEIWVDGKCIFRECYYLRENEDLGIIEGVLLTRMLNSVFGYGIMFSKSEIDKRPC